MRVILLLDRLLMLQGKFKDFTRCPYRGRDIVNILPISDLIFLKSNVSDDEVCIVIILESKRVKL